MDITIRVSTLDGSNRTRKFKTLAGARKFAQNRVGEHPEVSEFFRYAVGAWGDVKVSVTGCTLADLFPPKP